jgi:hypothetical protein
MKLHEQLSSVGSPTIRLDGRPKVTGTTRYTADHVLSGMIWGKCLRTPFLMLESVASTTKSKEKKGVFAVLTASGEEGESGCQFPWLVRLSRKQWPIFTMRSRSCSKDFERLSKLLLGSADQSALPLMSRCSVVLPKSTGVEGPRRLVMLFTNQCRRVFYYVARPPLLADFLHTRFVHRGPDPHFFIKLDGARMIGDRKVR